MPAFPLEIIGNCVDVEVTGSSGGNWEIIDSNGTTVASNLPIPSYVCLDPNECYQVYLSGGEDGESISIQPYAKRDKNGS